MIQDMDDTQSERSPPFEGDRKVLVACCHSPVTFQADLEWVRIVLLAPAERSTRSIDKEVGSKHGSLTFGGIAMPTMALKV